MSKKRNTFGVDYNDPKVQWRWLAPKLRKISKYWPPKAEALKKSKASGGFYLCAKCNSLKCSTDKQQDHVLPVAGVLDGEDISAPLRRLFCLVEGWQTLCTSCHQKKTNVERGKRKIARAKGN